MAATCCSRRRAHRCCCPRAVSNIIFVFAWAILLYMVYRMSTFEREQLYDPFEILGLEHVRAGHSAARTRVESRPA